jgi:protein phosphatase PTC7
MAYLPPSRLSNINQIEKWLNVIRPLTSLRPAAACLCDASSLHFTNPLKEAYVPLSYSYISPRSLWYRQGCPQRTPVRPFSSSLICKSQPGNGYSSKSEPSKGHCFELYFGAAAQSKTASKCIALDSNLVESSSKCNPSRPNVKSRPLDCGEDAFFIWEHQEYVVLGIADGVGGWNDVGIDPSLFAWELMHNCKQIAQEMSENIEQGNEFNLHPKHILSMGFERVLRQSIVYAGSSTALLVTFHKRSGKLISCNLGDSGFMIVNQKGEIVHKSTELQHYFNAPFQLAKIPPSMRKGAIDNTPADSMISEHQLNLGDIIVLATDGLFDNSFPSDIVHGIQTELASGRNNMASISRIKLSQVARTLVTEARGYAKNTRRQSPFAKGYSASTGQRVTGGKLDDITVITSLVINGNNASVSSN